jgi:hypothetical protein
MNTIYEQTIWSISVLSSTSLPFGIVHMFTHRRAKFTGKETFLRYPYLVSEDNLPFVRASGSQRVIDSATNWTLGMSYFPATKLSSHHHQGFTEASNHIYHAKLNLILDESVSSLFHLL